MSNEAAAKAVWRGESSFSFGCPLVCGLQTMGISQGSTLSAILCNLYYGALEQAGLFSPLGSLPLLQRSATTNAEPHRRLDFPRTTLPATSGVTTTCQSCVCPGAPRQTASLLVRLMDDYLFVSTSLKDAKRFVDICYNDLPMHGAHVKHTKSLVNFHHSVNDLIIAKVQVCGGEGRGRARLPGIQAAAAILHSSQLDLLIARSPLSCTLTGW